MSHDFSIRVLGTNSEGNTLKNSDKNMTANFFGYGEGFLYKAFNSWECNAGSSGNGTTKNINQKQAQNQLEDAIQRFEKLDYPDPSRMDELKQFYRDVVLQASSNTRYQLFFG